MESDDYRFMSRAFQLARRGLYTTDPNPRVGAVVVQRGEVVGEGWHVRAGEPHAERLALAAAGEAALGATVYVTLEPCSHHGRTPPCADALIAAGVSRVVASQQDPNPRVAGEGFARLERAGIAVEHGLLESEAEALNPGFLKRMRTGRPFVRCKLAMSLDGRTAMASGESQWITDESARRDVQRLRARSSAIVTGIGTVAADDPSLNVRLPASELDGMNPKDPVRQPGRVVLDTALRISPKARMLSLPGQTLVVTGLGCDPAQRGAVEAAGAEVLVLPLSQGRIDLAALLEELARREMNEVLVESGPTLAGAMLLHGLLDEIVIYAAPHVMGDGGRGLFVLPELKRMEERIELERVDLTTLGRDIRITLRPRVT